MLILITMIISVQTWSYVLLSPKFRLAKPEETKVRISSEGCTGNGISDDELGNAIEESIRIWSDIPESRLRLKFSSKSSTSVSSINIPKGEIIIGCAPLSGASGVANVDRNNGSGRIRLNSNELTPGSYTTAGLEGLIIHEMGHTIGLDHSKDPASVMTYESNGWSPKPSYLAQDDVDGVVYLYPNKPLMGGLLPSCESFASDETTRGNYFMSTMQMLFSFVLLRIIFLFVSRCFKKTNS